MRTYTLTGLWSLCALLMAPSVAVAQVAGYTPPTGYRTFSLNLAGGTVAISPTGKLAVATGRFGGGATITVYDRIVPQDRQVIATISSSQWQFFGGLAWRDDDTLLFSENGDLDTVLEWSLNTNTVTPLAPQGSLPNVADIAIVGSQVLALGADGPNQNRLYAITNGSVSLLVNGYGTGYAGGLGFRDDLLYAGDTNDPNFVGNPGQIFRYQPVYDANGQIVGANFVDSLSLASGGGSGIVSFVFDSEGDLIATTQRTLTQLRNGVAIPFGTFSGNFPFPTSIAYFGTRFEPFSGNGILVVNGSFTEVGGLFAITPVPEPSSFFLLSVGLAGLALRKRRG